MQDLFNFQWTSITGWTSSIGSSNLDSTCGEVMLGGLGKFGSGDWAEKTYSSLYPHYAARITFRLYFVESWDSEWYYLTVDGTQRYSEKWSLNDSPRDMCGSSTHREAVFFRTTTLFPHFSTTMTIYQTSTLNEGPSNEAFGFKSIQIFLLYCHSSCNTCIGPNENQCTSCAGTTYLNPLSNTCGSTCPDTYYADSTTHKCIRCYQFSSTSSSQSHSCQTCNGPNENNCLTCYPNVYLDPVNNKCVYVCPPQTWRDSSTYTCSPCYAPVAPATTPLACYTCSGSASTNCLSCYPGKFLDPTTSSCVSSPCPNGYYGSNGVCYPCYTKSLPTNPDESCNTCSGPYSNQCDSCAPGLFHDSGTNKCVTHCSLGWYEDLVTATCAQCYRASSSSDTERDCYTCTSNTPNSCESCYAGTYLTPSNTCEEFCPDGWWGDASIKTCKQCYVYDVAVPSDQSCATCTAGNSDNCLTCNSPYFFDSSTGSTGKCVSTCPDGYWGDSVNNVCSPCYESNPGDNVQSCKTCSGEGAAKCLTCHIGVFYHSVGESCLLSCPTGYFAESATYTCNQCYQATAGSSLKSCGTCYGGSSSNCLTCQDTSTFLYQGTCLEVCPPGTYANTTTLVCEPCFRGSTATHPQYSCSTCDGPSSTDCLSCSSGVLYYPTNSSCLSRCPSIGWYSDYLNNSCNTCYKPSSSNDPSQACLTCNGGLASNCLSCHPGTYLYVVDGTCLLTCPEKYYPDPNNWVCMSCAFPTAADEDMLSNCVNGSTGAQIAKTAFQITMGTSSALPPLLGGASSAATLLVDFLNEISIFIYINVVFPANFVLFIQQLSFSTLIPNPFEGLKRDTDVIATSTIGKFAFWETSTVLLENNGFNVFKSLLVLAIGGVFALITLVLSGKPNISRKFASVRNILIWNTFLSLYLGDFGELFMSSIIQMRENNSTGAYAMISLIMSSIIVASYSIIILVSIYILNKRYGGHMDRYGVIRARRNIPNSPANNNKKTQKRTDFVTVPHNYRSLSEELKESNPITRSFLVILTLQSLVVVLVLFLVQDLGVMQALFYMGAAIAVLIGVIYYKPFKSRLQIGLMIFNQLIKITMGLLATILGIDDYYQNLSHDVRTSIGTALIILILVGVGSNALIGVLLVISTIVTTIMRLVRSIREKMKKPKSYKAQENESVDNSQEQSNNGAELTNFLNEKDASKEGKDSKGKVFRRKFQQTKQIVLEFDYPGMGMGMGLGQSYFTPTRKDGGSAKNSVVKSKRSYQLSK